MSGTRTRIFYGWWVVVASAASLLFSEPAIAVYSFSVFLTAVSQDFHVGRGAISIAFTIHNLCTAAVSPFVGRLIDRVGARRVILPAAVLVGVVVISAKGIGGSLWQYYAFYFVLGILGPCSGPLPFSAVISRWFNRHRGLALGLMSFGSSLAAIIYPPLAQHFITRYGWRSAYAIFGFAMLVVPCVVVASFLKEEPQREGLFPDGIDPAKAQTVGRIAEGLGWNEIWRSGKYWLLIVACLLAGASAHACVLHLAPMLSDRGASSQSAANAVSVIGLAMFFGRTASGYFLDRFFAPWVCLVLFGQSALGVGFLACGASGALGVVAGFMVGLAFGAEVEVIAFLVSRYFGLRSFGVAYGAAFSSFVLAGAAGSFIMGASFDRMHSYTAPLVLFFAAMVVAAVLFSRLGPYRFAADASEDVPALTSEPEIVT